MLDMGFYDAIEDIIQQTPERRQTLLFSATYPVASSNCRPSSCVTRNR